MFPVPKSFFLTRGVGIHRDQLTAFEAFKFYGGQLHAVEAFIRILPIEKRKGGWEQDPAVAP